MGGLEVFFSRPNCNNMFSVVCRLQCLFSSIWTDNLGHAKYASTGPVHIELDLDLGSPYELRGEAKEVPQSHASCLLFALLNAHRSFLP